MSYEEFKKTYLSLTKKLLKYDPDTAGCTIYSEELGAIEDEYPDYMERLDNEY